MRLIADGVVEREGVPGPRPPPRLLAAAPDPAAHRRARRGPARAQPGAPRPHRPDAARRHRPPRRRRRILGRLLQRPPVQRDRARGVRDAAARAARAPARRPERRRGPRARRDRPRPAPPRARSTPPACSPGWARARSAASKSATATSFARTLRLSGGPAWFELRLDEVGRVRLRARLTHLGDLSTLVTRARRLFDLDADPIAVDEALARHPELAPLVARVPGIRVPGAADPHEMLIRAMVGQQITVAAARTALTALADALGEPVGHRRRPGCDARLFPTMAAIAERGHEVLRGPAARIRAIDRRGRGARRRLAAARARRRRRPTSVRRCSRCPGIGPVDRRLRAHARARRPRRVPARRRRRARGRGRAGIPPSPGARRLGRPHRAVAQLPDRSPVARSPPPSPAGRRARVQPRRPPTPTTRSPRHRHPNRSYDRPPKEAPR